MKSPLAITAPLPQKFASATELAAAYDHARELVHAYKNKYGDGNFHVVLGDGNIDRAFVAADYKDLANAASERGWTFYPDPEGLAWMKAVLILPEISHIGAMCGDTEPLFGVNGWWDETDKTEYILDVVCARCATYRELDHILDIYKEKVTCLSEVCEGRGEFMAVPLSYNYLTMDDVEAMLESSPASPDA